MTFVRDPRLERTARRSARGTKRIGYVLGPRLMHVKDSNEAKEPDHEAEPAIGGENSLESPRAHERRSNSQYLKSLAAKSRAASSSPA